MPTTFLPMVHGESHTEYRIVWLAKSTPVSNMASFVEHEVDGFVVISTNADQCICPAAEPKLLKAISEAAAEVGKEFWPINIKIHDNPELGYKEYIAHEALTSFMRRQPGWNVTPSAYGLETAWVAVFDSGTKGAVVSFNAEMGTFISQSWSCAC